MRTVYIIYREDGELTAASEVLLASQDGTYGIKTLSGDVVVPSGTATVNASLGRYEYSFDFAANTIYRISWKVTPNVGDEPRYIAQEVGPYEDSTFTIRATPESRGTFRQSTTATVFLKIAEINGESVDAETVTVTITTNDGTGVVASTVAEKVDTGFYAMDWLVPRTQEAGEYLVTWNYVVNGVERVETQSITVAADAPDTNLYSGRVPEFRANLMHMIHHAQFIPVYNEQARKSKDYKTHQFSFGRWNQSPGCKVYRNGNLVTSGYSTNFQLGQIIFDTAQTQYDIITADYNFRWFSDEELDRFLSNAIHMMNLFPPVTKRTLNNVEDNYIPIVLYGAVVDALRYMMLSLQFQEPQLVFGGPEGAARIFGELDNLKKNYEETWNKLLEQKKNGPYRGLTRMITTPPFALPGGRSRWFRYLFSGGSG